MRKDMDPGPDKDSNTPGSEGGDSDIPSQEEALAHLTDIALRIKEAIEDRNADALRAAFGPNAKVNIDGRFVTVDELATAAKEMLGPMEQPTFDILSIEQSEIQPASALISYLTELSWIDQKVWEEHTIKGVLTLHHTRTKKGWVTNGFTYARRPEPAKPSEEVGLGPTPSPPSGSLGGLAGLFGLAKGRDGDIWSMWY